MKEQIKTEEKTETMQESTNTAQAQTGEANGTEQPASKTMDTVFILDESGSMYSLWNDTINNVNGLIDEQKKLQSEEGYDIKTTLVTFSSSHKTLIDRKNIADVSPVKKSDYAPNGTTALYDAVGDTIAKIEKKRLEENSTGAVKFFILTDGMENCSREYNYAKINHLLETKKAENWEFAFFGAGIDADIYGRELGIDREMCFTVSHDTEGMASFSKIAMACMITPDFNEKKATKLKKQFRKQQPANQQGDNQEDENQSSEKSPEAKINIDELFHF